MPPVVNDDEGDDDYADVSFVADSGALVTGPNTAGFDSERQSLGSFYEPQNPEPFSLHDSAMDLGLEPVQATVRSLETASSEHQQMTTTRRALSNLDIRREWNMPMQQSSSSESSEDGRRPMPSRKRPSEDHGGSDDASSSSSGMERGKRRKKKFTVMPAGQSSTTSANNSNQ